MVNAETLKEFAKAGIAGLFAGILLVFFLTDVRADQKATRTEHVNLREDIASIKNIAGQSDMSQQKILSVLLALCLNNSRTEDQRHRCVDAIDLSTK